MPDEAQRIILISAPSRRHAERMAEEHNLSPMAWRYIPESPSVDRTCRLIGVQAMPEDLIGSFSASERAVLTCRSTGCPERRRIVIRRHIQSPLPDGDEGIICMPLEPVSDLESRHGSDTLPFNWGTGNMQAAWAQQHTPDLVSDGLIDDVLVSQDIEASVEERRHKHFLVREREILLAFYRQVQNQYVVGIEPMDLPRDCRLCRVYHDPSRACFVFVVQHSSFNIVPEGEEPPIAGALAFQYRTLSRNADGRYDLSTRGVLD